MDAQFEKVETIDKPNEEASRCAPVSSLPRCLTGPNRNDSDLKGPAEGGNLRIEIKERIDKGASDHGGWRTMPFIFGNEICEKLAAIGFSANMIVYLTQQLHMDNVKAANVLTNFGGTSSLTPLIGAFIADAYVGRFWMITVSSVVYLLGLSFLTLTAMEPSLRPAPCSSASSSCVPASTSQLAVVFLGFLLISVGAGGIRPCVAAFGAEQFDKQAKQLRSFFNWYYFCMGVSALTAVTVIVYVQDSVGWALGFGIPAGLMFVSIISFVLGLPLYVHQPPMGSPLTRLVRVLVAAFRKRNLDMPPDAATLCLYELQDKELQASNNPSRLQHTPQFKFLDRAAVMVEGQDGSVNPWKLCRVTEVEELKSILRMAPIWASGILLITASAQQNTFSVLQARTMNRRLHMGTSSFQIPPGSMSVFAIASLLITVPLYDRLFMPVARRITGLPRGITFLQRMGVGFLIATLATLVAALVELKRKHVARDHGLLDSPTTTIPISVLWLLPQYSLHGIAEAFMSVAHLEFFYDQSPDSMRSTATALFWSTISAGNYLSSFLVSMIHQTTEGPAAWLPDNLNRGHLDYLFWLLTVLQLGNFVFFLVAARWYKYKPVQPQPQPDGHHDTMHKS